jgi:hypothetical protein
MISKLGSTAEVGGHVGGRRARWRRLLVLTSLPVLVATQGCVNLGAIRDFAAISSASVRYRALVDDYVAAPERLARYAPEGKSDDYSKRAADRKQQESGFLLMQVTVQAYMDSLGNLAADDVVDYSKEYGDLGGAISKAKFASKQDADSLTTIANVLTKAATDAWRQKKLRGLIEGTNDSLQQVIASMQLVMHAFELDVSIEQTAAESYYKGLYKRSHDAAGIAAAREWAGVRSEEIAARQEAIANYSTVLTKIGQGHQHLYDHRNDLDKDTLAQIKSYAQELKKAYKALQDLRS